MHLHWTIKVVRDFWQSWDCYRHYLLHWLIFAVNTTDVVFKWKKIKCRHTMHWDTLATALQSTYKIVLLTTIYNAVLTASGVTTTRAAYTQQHPEQAPPTDWHSLSESTTLIQWETEEANQWQESGLSGWSQSWNSQHWSLKTQIVTKTLILLVEEFSCLN